MSNDLNGGYLPSEDTSIVSDPVPIGRERKNRGTEFEKSIMAFLEKLEFKDIDGGRDTFRINGNQVDACGGHVDTLFIVECTAKKDWGAANAREKIKAVRGVRESLVKGFRAHDVYCKYKHHEFVLAIKNAGIRKEDIEFANSESRVYLWDDNFITYYQDLYKKIGRFSKYNLLGEMGVRPVSQNAIRVPAAKYTWNEKTMFLFFIRPSVLLEVAYVARRYRPNERYYQRIIDKERLTSISKYVMDGNILPNNIIIAFASKIVKQVKFEPLPKQTFGEKEKLAQAFVEQGVLEFPSAYNSCWIIDGQHRLYSFMDFEKPVCLPVVAFQDLDREKQCKMFLDINKFQKPVSSDLVWDLNGDMIPSEVDGIISNAVKQLNEKGPLGHKIFIPSKGFHKKNAHLRMAGICLAIKRVKLASPTTKSKTKNPFHSDGYEKTVTALAKGLSEYFFVMQGLFQEDWELGKKGYVLSDAGIGVMIRYFEKIVSHCKDRGAPNRPDYAKYLTPLQSFLTQRFSAEDGRAQLRRNSSSEGGKDYELRDIILCVRQKLQAPQFGGDIPNVGMVEINKLEGDLKKLIENELKEDVAEDAREDETEDWIKGKIPEDMYGRLVKLMNKHNYSIENIHQSLTFGECFEVMRIHKTKFYPFFVGEDKNMFDDNRAFETAFAHIIKMRTQRSHHAPLALEKPHDINLFNTYLDLVNKCLAEVLGDDASLPKEEDDDN